MKQYPRPRELKKFRAPHHYLLHLAPPNSPGTPAPQPACRLPPIQHAFKHPQEHLHPTPLSAMELEPSISPPPLLVRQFRPV